MQVPFTLHGIWYGTEQGPIPQNSILKKYFHISVCLVKNLSISMKRWRRWKHCILNFNWIHQIVPGNDKITDDDKLSNHFIRGNIFLFTFLFVLSFSFATEGKQVKSNNWQYCLSLTSIITNDFFLLLSRS